MLPARPAHRRLSFATVLLFGFVIVTARYADAAGDGAVVGSTSGLAERTHDCGRDVRPPRPLAGHD